MALGLFTLGAILAAPVQAEMSAEELAKLAQNPVGGGVGKIFHRPVCRIGPHSGPYGTRFPMT